jgi:sulfur relay protein TusB/DsrH
MAILHTINQSPKHSGTWNKVLSLLSSGDHLLLIEDACYAPIYKSLLRQLTELSEQRNIEIFTLKPDAEARGLPSYKQLTEIDYQGFVSLTAKTEKTINWCSE